MRASRRSSSALAPAVLLLLVFVAPRAARGQELGVEGESCRARSDCAAGLRCVEARCAAPAAEEAAPATGEASAPAGAVAPSRGGPASAWTGFELGGTHLFGGLTFAPGLTGFWPYGGGVAVEAALLFGLRVGVLFDRVELAAELVPVTWWWRLGADPTLTFNLSVGGLLRVADRVHWPLRFGLGLAAVGTPTDEVYMLGRLDLIGLAYQYGHLLFELSLPSVRFSTEFQSLGIWAWLFNLSVTYVI